MECPIYRGGWSCSEGRQREFDRKKGDKEKMEKILESLLSAIKTFQSFPKLNV
jgi:hypothetical protein